MNSYVDIWCKILYNSCSYNQRLIYYVQNCFVDFCCIIYKGDNVYIEQLQLKDILQCVCVCIYHTIIIIKITHIYHWLVFLLRKRVNRLLTLKRKPHRMYINPFWYIVYLYMNAFVLNFSQMYKTPIVHCIFLNTLGYATWL